MRACQKIVLSFNRDDVNKITSVYAVLNQLYCKFHDVYNDVKDDNCDCAFNEADYMFETAVDAVMRLSAFIEDRQD